VQLRYQVHAEDHSWGWIYQPLMRLLHASVRRTSKIQTGNLRHYLSYSLVTLLVLLWLIT